MFTTKLNEPNIIFKIRIIRFRISETADRIIGV